MDAQQKVLLGEVVGTLERAWGVNFLEGHSPYAEVRCTQWTSSNNILARTSCQPDEGFSSSFGRAANRAALLLYLDRSCWACVTPTPLAHTSACCCCCTFVPAACSSPTVPFPSHPPSCLPTHPQPTQLLASPSIAALPVQFPVHITQMEVVHKPLAVYLVLEGVGFALTLLKRTLGYRPVVEGGLTFWVYEPASRQRGGENGAAAVEEGEGMVEAEPLVFFHGLGASCRLKLIAGLS